MEWGQHEKQLERRVKKGKKTPAWEKRVDIYEDLQATWEAFAVLCQTRTTGWSANPLQPSEVLAVLALYGFSASEGRREAFELILVLDGVWLEWMRERLEAKGNN